jgi:hypothetical protein
VLLQRSKTRQATLALALVAACVTIAPAARAELNLQWDAPPGCPRRTEVLDRIRALAGSSLDKTEGLSAEGEIAHAKGRFWLTLRVRDGRDVRKRQIASESCADLAGAAAISLALLLGIDVSKAGPQADSDELGQEAPKDGAPDADGRNANDQRSGEDRSQRSHELPERSDARAERSAAPDDLALTRRWALLVRAPILAADLGPLPDPSLGAGLGVGLRYDSWKVVLAGHVYRGQTVGTEGGAFGEGADVDRVTGQLVICRAWRSGPFELAPCLGLALEHLTARGFGQRVAPESRRAIWPAPSAGAVAEWYPLKSVALFAGMTGYLELARPRLVIEGLREIRQLSPLAAGAVIGVEWIL